MKLVGRSLVSAITQTPASAPCALFTTPEMYPTGARRCACRPSPARSPLIMMDSADRRAHFMRTPPNATTQTRKHDEELLLLLPSWLRDFVVAFPLHVHDVEDAAQAFQRVAARRRPVLVRDVSGEAQIGDRLGHEPVVELLRVVELAAAGNAGGMEVRDPRKVVANVRANVAVHDLDVVDVEEDLHAGRVHPLAEIHAPRQVVEDGIGAAELGIRVL